MGSLEQDVGGTPEREPDSRDAYDRYITTIANAMVHEPQADAKSLKSAMERALGYEAKGVWAIIAALGRPTTQAEIVALLVEEHEKILLGVSKKLRPTNLAAAVRARVGHATKALAMFELITRGERRLGLPAVPIGVTESGKELMARMNDEGGNDA